MTRPRRRGPGGERRWCGGNGRAPEHRSREGVLAVRRRRLAHGMVGLAATGAIAADDLHDGRGRDTVT